MGYEIRRLKPEVMRSNHTMVSLDDDQSNIVSMIHNTINRPVEPKQAIASLFKLKDVVEHLISVKCEEYYGGHPKHILWDIHYQFILENIEPGSVVFDVGTGASLSYTQKLASICKQVDCCDIKPELIEKSASRNRYRNVKYFVQDITKVLPDEKYDVVILSHVLEHLYEPEKALENLHSITKKIIVRLPRYDNHWMYLVKKDLGLFYFKDADHKKEYTLSEAKHLVESAEWDVKIALNDIDIKIVAVGR